MFFHLYLRNGIAIVPTLGRVLPGGPYRDMEPVTVAPFSNPEALRRALRDAISRGNPPAPRYPPGGHPQPVVVKYAGVKSWSAFARGTLPWGISEREGNYQIVGYCRHPDGWREDPKQKVDLPAGSTVDDAIDRMMAILQDAARK
jgi:hypothetical protein